MGNYLIEPIDWEQDPGWEVLVHHRHRFCPALEGDWDIFSEQEQRMTLRLDPDGFGIVGSEYKQ